MKMDEKTMFCLVPYSIFTRTVFVFAGKTGTRRYIAGTGTKRFSVFPSVFLKSRVLLGYSCFFCFQNTLLGSTKTINKKVLY
jgi:hypothetical protein